MATQSTDSLVQGAACINSCITGSMQWAVMISLLAKIAGVSASTDSLMQNASCINSCIPDGMKLAVMISLLSQIVSGGGVGGGAVTIVTSDPQGILTPTAQGQEVFNTNDNTLWINIDGTVTGWVKLI